MYHAITHRRLVDSLFKNIFKLIYVAYINILLNFMPIMDDIIKWVKSASSDPEVLDQNLRYINSLILEGKIDQSSLQYNGKELTNIQLFKIDSKGYIRQTNPLSKKTRRR
jgi:hypothetical protein